MSMFLVAVLFLTAAVLQGPTNLIENPAAERGAHAWQAEGNAVVEEFSGNRCFVVRNGGRFRQRVNVPIDAVGKFVVFIARVSGERTAADITDRPYLYGLRRGTPHTGSAARFDDVGLFIFTCWSRSKPMPSFPES